MIQRFLVCLLALAAIFCSPVAAAGRNVWLFESGTLTRMDIDAGSVRSIVFSQPVCAIAAGEGSGAWVLTDDALVLIDEELDERLRVKLDFAPVAGATKLAADAVSGSVWVAHDSRLRNFAADGTLVGEWSVTEPVRAMAVAGPKEIFIATDLSLTRYNAAGAPLSRIDLTQVAGKGAESLLADGPAAYLWLARTGALVQFDVLAGMAPRLTIPTGNPVALSLDPQSGMLTALAGQGIARYARDGVRQEGALFIDEPLIEVAGIATFVATPYLWFGDRSGVGSVEFADGVVRRLPHTGAVAHFVSASVKPPDRVVPMDANQVPTVAITAPANDAIFAAPSSITLTATASAGSGTISAVYFFVNEGLVGIAETAPYSVVWNVARSGAFTLTAWATDNEDGLGVSPPINVQVTDNAAPTVELSAPVNNATFTAPATFELAANANDADGTIATVEFFVNGSYIGSDGTAPYTFNWTVFAARAYTLMARAVDNTGNVTPSAPINVQVYANGAPTVTLSTPAHNATFNAPANVELAATASDSDGTIATVEFFVNGSYIGSDDTAPYTSIWNVAGAGTYALTARAFDDTGNWSESAPVTVTVSLGRPTVAITSPSHGSLFVAPATVAISANAEEPEGTIAQVDFYLDNTYLGTAIEPPYSLMWRSTAVGTYSLTARAFDNQWQSTTSAPITVTVSALPGRDPTWVEMTAPAANARLLFTPATTIALEAQAIHPMGAAVTQVTFFYAPSQGSPRLIATTSVLPYRVTWTPPSDLNLGDSYVLWAEATDASGTVTPSRGVPITVDAGNAPLIRRLAPYAASGPVVLTAPATVVFIGEAFDRDGPSGAGSLQRVDLVDDGNVVDTLAAANGAAGEYVFTRRDLPVGTRRYTIAAVDTLGLTADSPVTIVQVIAANAPPTALLSAPASGQKYVAPATVALAATVTDPDGAITKVDYLSGAGVVATSTAPPFDATWANAPAGDYTLTARATDDRGVSAVSPVAYVKVLGTGSAPLVALTAPAICGSLSNATPITIAAEAISPSSSITKVEFLAGASLIGTATAEPFTAVWTNAAAGTTNLTARVYDALGQVTTSAPFPVSVIASNQSPTIGLTAPADGQAFLVGQPITLAATAADSDGTVTQVEFFAGGTLLGSASTMPYSLVWSGAAPGVHVLTAKVTDNNGATSTASARKVTVTTPNSNQAPAIALTAPANGQSFTVGQTITLAASAADADGVVSRVEFFSGAELLGTVTAAPHTWQWTGVSLGSHTLTAIATDDRGASTTSLPVSIRVLASAGSGLAVTSPAPNTAVAADFILVRGTYNAPPNSGVTVNGTVAKNDGQGQFFVNNLPLVEGENSISVILTTADGQTQTQTVTVNRSGAAPLQIVAEPDAGFGELTTTLRVHNRTANLMTEFSISNVGDGHLDIAGADQELLGTITYRSPGVYQPTLTVIDSMGNAYTQTVTLLVRDQAAHEQTLTRAWNAFSNSIAAGDRTAAMAYLSDGAKAKYGPAFDALLPHLATIVTSWSAPQASKLAETFAEFAINRTIDGVIRLFLIYLLQGHDGVFRIDSM